MADSSGKKSKSRGVVAEYDTPDALIAAANRVREAGYTKTDAFSPFPVHGIDQAIGIKPTILPWIVLVAGIIGCATGLTMQTWMNAIDYPYIISGKPFISLPAFIPVSFELTILFAAFAAFFGQWFLNGLPRFSNPMFTNPKFDAATDDKFFLYIDSRDARFNDAGARSLLSDTGPLSVDDVYDDNSPTAVPRVIYLSVLVLAVLSVFPLLIIADMRVTNSSSPRIHLFWDMDFMPYKEAQEATILFRDGRVMRPTVPGTVMRGGNDFDIDNQTGIQMEALAVMDPVRATQLIAQADAANREPGDAAGEEAEAVDTTPWVTENPLPVDRETLARGREQFEIYCAVCHGRDGFGSGLVSQRAKRILATTWTQPTSLHEDRLLSDEMPDGKIFHTITKGIRKMPGYAGQIAVKDRWAITAYVRVLQASRNVTLDEIPADQRSRLAKEADEERQKIEAAEAERLKKQQEEQQDEQEAASETAEEPAANVDSEPRRETVPEKASANTSTDQEKPAVEEKPAAEEKPADEDKQADEEKPASDAKPAAAEEKPVDQAVSEDATAEDPS